MQSETAELPIEGRYRLTGRVTTYDLGPVELHTALDRQLERTVTMQLLPASTTDEEKARFLESQRIAAGIHHCGVVQVYDVGEWHGAHFSVIEKDAAARGGPAPAPDAGSALATARQVAEALQCVRDAGLRSWAFTPAALRTGADGAPRLALLEGLQNDSRYGAAVSTRREDDGRALGALLGMLIAGLPLAAVPAGVHELVEDAPPAAGEFAAEVARLEQAAVQLTEQHVGAQASGAIPYLAAIDSHDAPTLAAAVVSAAVVSANTLPYGGPPAAEAEYIAPGGDEPRRRSLPLVPFAAFGLLILALLTAVAWPRGDSPGQLAGSAVLAADSTPTSAPTAEPTVEPTALAILAPEFVGKTLPEAKALASAAGVGLVISSAAHDAQYPVDTVSRQDPAPGSPLSPGAEVSLVLSLGPEPQPEQPVEQPPPPPSGDDDDDKDDKENDKKGNERGKKKP